MHRIGHTFEPDEDVSQLRLKPSPPSPPETRRVILRTRELVRRIFVVEDYSTAFSSCGYLEKSPESRFGLEGYHGLLLHSVHLDGIQHGDQNHPALGRVGFLP